MDDSLSWRPERPCRPEVAAVVRYVQDCLLAQGLPHVAEQDDVENPDCWAIAAADRAGRENLVLVSWSPEEGRVVYAALKAEVARHDEMEGVPEDASLCWWRPNSARMAVQALDGTVAEVVAQFRREQFRLLDGADDSGAPEVGDSEHTEAA